MKNRHLEGKYAIITGASRGIGQAIAAALAGEGAGVVICSRGKSEGNEARSLFSFAEEIRSMGAQAVAVRSDVSREEDVNTIVRQALETFGRVDILVNNAGVFPNYHSPLVDYPIESWDETMATNLRGVFLCIKAVLPQMIEQKAGCIINISSIAAVRSGKGRIAYGVSKAGVERLTFGLAEEVKEYNIAINALCPVGLTDTESARKLFPEQNPDRWVKPEDVAEAAIWLACQSASTFTGKAVMVPAHGRRTIFIYGRGAGERPWVQID
ncbi:MAG: SDR family oxidoreductase [Deltaproteobacteria bacterium]|nr:SDR family oxidoreductase [Deltaproteobacteria bacterium]